MVYIYIKMSLVKLLPLYCLVFTYQKEVTKQVENAKLVFFPISTRCSMTIWLSKRSKLIEKFFFVQKAISLEYWCVWRNVTDIPLLSNLFCLANLTRNKREKGNPGLERKCECYKGLEHKYETKNIQRPSEHQRLHKSMYALVL